MNPLYILIPIMVVALGAIFATNQYSLLEIIMMFFFVAIIFLIGANYFLGIQMTTTLQNLFNKPAVNIDIVQPTEDQKQPVQPVDPRAPKTLPPQVFHVQGQYNYTESKAICKAYNGKLASITQMHDAYEKGAEWCDYGWSGDGMVLYPTQYDTWKSYQGTDREKKCGIPGLNGGYNQHKQQKLGVNCYGKKPDGKMPIMPSPAIRQDPALSWLTQKLTVSPFNYTKWSEY
jgi:hypothetical protein